MILMFGEFQFAPALRGDNVHEYERASEARLAPQDVVGQRPPVQWIGPGSGGVTIHGVLLPEYAGGLGQIDGMHAATEDGRARPLVSGYGMMFGYFQMKRVAEKRRHLTPQGLPRKIEFTLDLLRDGDGFLSFFKLF